MVFGDKLVERAIARRRLAQGTQEVDQAAEGQTVTAAQMDEKHRAVLDRLHDASWALAHEFPVPEEELLNDFFASELPRSVMKHPLFDGMSPAEVRTIVEAFKREERGSEWHSKPDLHRISIRATRMVNADRPFELKTPKRYDRLCILADKGPRRAARGVTEVAPLFAGFEKDDYKRTLGLVNAERHNAFIKEAMANPRQRNVMEKQRELLDLEWLAAQGNKEAVKAAHDLRVALTKGKNVQLAKVEEFAPFRHFHKEDFTLVLAQQKEMQKNWRPIFPQPAEIDGRARDLVDCWGKEGPKRTEAEAIIEHARKVAAAKTSEEALRLLPPMMAAWRQEDCVALVRQFERLRADKTSGARALENEKKRLSEETARAEAAALADAWVDGGPDRKRADEKMAALRKALLAKDDASFAHHLPGDMKGRKRDEVAAFVREYDAELLAKTTGVERKEKSAIPDNYFDIEDATLRLVAVGNTDMMQNLDDWARGDDSYKSIPRFAKWTREDFARLVERVDAPRVEWVPERPSPARIDEVVDNIARVSTRLVVSGGDAADYVRLLQNTARAELAAYVECAQPGASRDRTLDEGMRANMLGWRREDIETLRDKVAAKIGEIVANEGKDVAIPPFTFDERALENIPFADPFAARERRTRAARVPIGRPPGERIEDKEHVRDLPKGYRQEVDYMRRLAFLGDTEGINEARKWAARENEDYKVYPRLADWQPRHFKRLVEEFDREQETWEPPRPDRRLIGSMAEELARECTYLVIRDGQSMGEAYKDTADRLREYELLVDKSFADIAAPPGSRKREDMTRLTGWTREDFIALRDETLRRVSERFARERIYPRGEQFVLEDMRFEGIPEADRPDFRPGRATPPRERRRRPGSAAASAAPTAPPEAAPAPVPAPAPAEAPKQSIWERTGLKKLWSRMLGTNERPPTTP